MTEHARPVEPMALYQCYWAAGGASGTLNVWAPDGATAVATVQANPSAFGLSCEHPIIGRPTRLELREVDLDEFGECAA